MYIGIIYCHFGEKKRAYVQGSTVNLQERFLRKLYVYTHSLSQGVTHNKTATFVITEVETSNLANEKDHAMLIMMTTVDKEIVPR
jgi:hypothetical protein